MKRGRRTDRTTTKGGNALAPPVVAAGKRRARRLVGLGMVTACLAGTLATGPDDGPPVGAPPPGMESEVTVNEAGRVNLHVTALDLAKVLRMLSVKSRRNIIASSDVNGKVTADLYNVTMEEALEAILGANHAGYRQDGDFIYVHTAEELAEIAAAASPPRVTRIHLLNLILAKEAKAHIEPLLEEGDSVSMSTPDTDRARTPQDVADTLRGGQEYLVVTARPGTHLRIENVLREIAKLAGENAGGNVRPVTQIYPLTCISAQEAKSYVKMVVEEKYISISKPPGSKAGPSSDDPAYADGAKEFIIVTAGPEIQTQVEHMLREIDELAEAAAKESAARASGPVARVHLLNYISAQDAKSYVEPLMGKHDHISTSPSSSSNLKSSPEDGGGNANAAQDFIIVTARPETQGQVESMLRAVDVQPKQVLVEATILRAELADENALGIDFRLVGGVDLEELGAASRAITDINLGDLPQNRLERFNANVSSDFSGDVPSGGLTIGIIKDHVAVFLRALEQVTDTTVLANPKVLALNKQKGQVIVGRRDGFLTTTVTEVQAIQTVEFLETGTQLIFRPFVGNDGWIRMELHPEDSVGFVNAQGLPSEQTTEVTTNVLVRDGETILIGGLFREVTTDTRRQIPLLGGLPVIGPFFQSRQDHSTREEVIILLTVHIVKDRAAYVADSLEVYEDLDRLRVGVRRGLMWHGRERVAQRHYHQATKAYAAGDESKALWHLNMALYNHPRCVPAIRLKEQILMQRDWDDESSMCRDFVHRLIAREQGYDGPLLGRPRPPTDGRGAAALGDEDGSS